MILFYFFSHYVLCGSCSFVREGPHQKNGHLFLKKFRRYIHTFATAVYMREHESIHCPMYMYESEAVVIQIGENVLARKCVSPSECGRFWHILGRPVLKGLSRLLHRCKDETPPLPRVNGDIICPMYLIAGTGFHSSNRWRTCTPAQQREQDIRYEIPA